MIACFNRESRAARAELLVHGHPAIAFASAQMQRQHHDPVSAATMSDDEFGYDFETDDEELLIQLASNASKQSTDAVALIAAASSAEKTVAGFKASQEVKAFHERVYPHDALALTPGNKGKAPEAPVWGADQKRARSSASSAHDPVAYPDCEHEFNFTVLG